MGFFCSVSAVFEVVYHRPGGIVIILSNQNLIVGPIRRLGCYVIGG